MEKRTDIELIANQIACEINEDADIGRVEKLLLEFAAEIIRITKES